MFAFNFYNPTKLIFGKGKISSLSINIPKDSKVLVTYGGGSIKSNGVYDEVKAALADFNVVEFGGIEPNPEYTTLVKAIEIVKEEGVDFILAVGGGSVIDGSKFIAAGACIDGDPWGIMNGTAKINNAIKLGTILTLPATGSETNCGSVISRREFNAKFPFMNPHVFPKFSILDPEKSLSLTSHLVGNGVVDAFVHVLEQYVTYDVNAPLQDSFSEGILRTLLEQGPKTFNDLKDYDSRANVMLCATMALNGLIGSGVPQDWTTHYIGHVITALFGLDHARSLAIILPAVMQYQGDNRKDKMQKLLKNVFQVELEDENNLTAMAIDLTKQFFESVGVPTSFSAYNFGQKEVDKILDNISTFGDVKWGEKGDVDLEGVKKILDIAIAANG